MRKVNAAKATQNAPDAYVNESVGASTFREWTFCVQIEWIIMENFKPQHELLKENRIFRSR